MPDPAERATWTKVAFGDVVNHIKDRVSDVTNCDLTEYIRGEHFKPGSLRLIGRSTLGDGKHGSAFCMRFQPGDVLYVSRNPQLRKAAVADFAGICANTTYVCRANEKYLLQELLPFIMQTERFVEYTIRHKRGSTNFYLNWSDIAGYEFALAPLGEQRRIAEVLQATEENINALRRLGDEIETLRRSAIDELTFGLSAARSTVGVLCSMQNGRPFPGSEYCDDGQLLLRPGNLDPTGYLTWDEGSTKRVPHRYREEASEFVVEPGDVLINLTAQSLEDGFMGRVCLACDGDESLLNQRIGRFRQFSDQLLPEFLFRVLQSSDFQRHAISMCEGSKIKHLFWQHIERFEFPLPSPKEQARVIEELRNIDAAVMDAEQRLGSAMKLKNQLLRVGLHDGVGSCV